MKLGVFGFANKKNVTGFFTGYHYVITVNNRAHHGIQRQRGMGDIQI